MRDDGAVLYDALVDGAYLDRRDRLHALGNHGDGITADVGGDDIDLLV